MKKWSKKKKGVVIVAGVALLGLAGTCLLYTSDAADD